MSVTLYKPPSFSHCYIQSLVFSCQNQSENLQGIIQPKIKVLSFTYSKLIRHSFKEHTVSIMYHARMVERGTEITCLKPINLRCLA